VRDAVAPRLIDPRTLAVPIYDYRCSSCGHLVEILHGVHESGPAFCPSCGAEASMRKAIAAPTVHFKGSGWAKKDRSAATRSKAKAAADGTDSAPKGGGSSGDDKKGTGETTTGSAASADAKSDSKPASSDSKPAADPA
jgi:putative FmdB family regulatory protein